MDNACTRIDVNNHEIADPWPAEGTATMESKTGASRAFAIAIAVAAAIAAPTIACTKHPQLHDFRSIIEIQYSPENFVRVCKEPAAPSSLPPQNLFDAAHRVCEHQGYQHALIQHMACRRQVLHSFYAKIYVEEPILAPAPTCPTFDSLASALIALKKAEIDTESARLQAAIAREATENANRLSLEALRNRPQGASSAVANVRVGLDLQEHRSDHHSAQSTSWQSHTRKPAAQTSLPQPRPTSSALRVNDGTCTCASGCSPTTIPGG